MYSSVLSYLTNDATSDEVRNEAIEMLNAINLLVSEGDEDFPYSAESLRLASSYVISVEAIIRSTEFEVIREGMGRSGNKSLDTPESIEAFATALLEVANERRQEKTPVAA